MLMLSSMLLVKPAKASEPGYTLTEAYQTSAVTVDGKWTSSSEWSDAWIITHFSATNAMWAYKMDANSGTYLMSFLLESPDNTNDAGDKWTICLDGSANGGTAPQTDDDKIEITGHTTLNVYVGNGTGWSPLATSAVTWKDSLATSAYITANHYILEVQIDKASIGSWGANPPPTGVYIAMSDASNATNSVAWPPTSPDNPSRWGLITDYTTTLPESINAGFVVLLSSVAVVAGFYILRKRPTKNLTPKGL